MIEHKDKLITYRIYASCNCGGYFEKLSHVTHWPNPNTTYPHKCDKCGKIENFKKIYPTIEYKVEPPLDQEE